MKKILAITMAALVMGVFVAGCSGGEAAPADKPADTAGATAGGDSK